MVKERFSVYFAGSIRGGRVDVSRYFKIIDAIKEYGEVLTEHVGDSKLLDGEKGMTDLEIHDRDMAWLRSCNVVCAEVTQPSLGVGYELAMAMELKIPVICLFYPLSGNKLSAMIAGQPYFKVYNYDSVDGLKVVFDKLWR